MQTIIEYKTSIYNVESQLNGYTISVDRATSDGEAVEVFFAQGNDAGEFVALFESSGALALLEYLDSAGVEL